MKKEDIKALIVARIDAGSGQCNSYYVNHLEGQLRALEYVVTGKPPESEPCYFIPDYLDRVGIPWNWADEKENRFAWDTEWLEEHGFEITGEGASAKIHHPKYSIGW